MAKVLILGGGVAGLTAAMELVNDFEVTVIERRPIVGGKARTWTDDRYEVFREHSFRVFHQSYHNLFDTMRRIPRGSATVYDQLEDFVSAKKLFASYPKTWEAYRSFQNERTARDVLLDVKDFGRLAGALVASKERLAQGLGNVSFEDLFTKRDDGSRGLVYDVLRGMSQVEYSANRVNPDLEVMIHFIEKHFLHGPPGIGWKALTAPTSDAFISPMRAYLDARGVRFVTATEVTGIHLDEKTKRIAVVDVRDRETDRAYGLAVDHVVSALTSDVLTGLLDESHYTAAPSLRVLGELHRVSNNGVLVYSGKVEQPAHGYYMWHPWRIAVTTYAHRFRDEAFFAAQGRASLRGRIKDVISYCVCDWEEPGIRVAKRALDCSPEEIYEELCFAHEADGTVLPGFDKKDHVFPIDEAAKAAPCLVDEALIYDKRGKRIVKNEDSLVHLPPGYSAKLPTAKTGIENLALAGCHVKHGFGCGDSMEGANETGRLAANAVLERAGMHRRVPILSGRVDSNAVQLLELARAVDARATKFLASR